MSVFASRYARALADAVTAAGLDAGRVLSLLEDFSATLRGSRELREVLENPSVAMDIKLKVIDAVTARIGARATVPHQVRNFIALLTQNHRLKAMDEVLADFRAVTDARSGVQEAEIISARPLSDAERKRLAEPISKLAGGKVRATYREDASLIGGVWVRIGSTVYDGSIRGQLDKLKQVLSAE